MIKIVLFFEDDEFDDAIEIVRLMTALAERAGAEGHIPLDVDREVMLEKSPQELLEKAPMR